LQTSGASIKPCVFCGHPVRDPATERIRAREHVFPFWVLDEFGVARDIIEFSPFEATREDGASLQVTIQTPIRRFDLNNFLLGAVCSVCNSGWMSRLETRVQPNLIALIKGDTVGSLDREALAKWALKTAYALWRYLNPPVGHAPLSHGLDLVGDGTTLPAHVAVFHRQAADWRIWFSACMTFAVETGDPQAMTACYERAYKVLVQLGHAQLLVQYFPLPGSEIAYDPAVARFLNANARVVEDSGLNIAGSGMTDANARFMMSNLIRALDSDAEG
jgi:hypothetical protein